MTNITNENTIYGLTALPADQSAIKPATTSPSPIDISSLQPPATSLAKRITTFAQSHLSPDTFRHSLRVYSYGRAIAIECFPQFNLVAGSALDETWYLTALLHDIGTVPDVLKNTKLSYEFWAGYKALDLLQHSSAPSAFTAGKDVAPRVQAESVAEAIIRHQDVQPVGSITLVTRLIHLGTLLDNIGAGSELVNPMTIRAVNEAYDRKGWGGCFADTVRLEREYKPWTMVSRIDGFEEKIKANGEGLMKQWDQ